MAALAGCMPSTRAPRPQSWAYASWWQPLQHEGIVASRFDRLIYFDITLDTDGSVADAHGWPDRQASLRESARTLDVPLDVAVSLHGREALTRLFSSPSSVNRLLATCLTLADDPAVAGLQLDFEVHEALPAQARRSLLAFVPRLRKALESRHPGHALTVFVPISMDPLYSRRSLAGVDWVVMQGYDAHWTGSANAGPVAPLDGPDLLTWEHVARHARELGVPPSRTLMGFPLYGYEWTVDAHDPRARTLGPGVAHTLEPVDNEAAGPLAADSIRRRVNLYGCQRDEQTGSTYYQFLDGQQRDVVGWYESDWSLRRKAAFVGDHKLAGLAFFAGGGDGYRLTRTYHALRTATPDAAVPDPAPC